MAQDRDISHARREEAATALRQVCSVHTHMIDTSIHTCHDIYQHIYIYALRQARAALGDSQAHNLRMHEELRAKVRAAVSAAGERDQCAAELRQATGELDEARPSHEQVRLEVQKWRESQLQFGQIWLDNTRAR